MLHRRIFAALVVLCAIAPAYAQKTKTTLNAEIGVQFPDNSVGAITPSNVRSVTSDIVNSIMPTAPVTTGDLTCFDGTTGLLKDCAIAPPMGAIVGTSDTQTLTNKTINCLNNTCNAQPAPYTAPNTSPAAQTIQQQLSKIPVTCDDFGTCGTSDDTANILAAMQYASANGRPFLVNRNFNVSDLVITGLTNNLNITGQGAFTGQATGSNGAVVEIKDTTGITIDGNVSISCSGNAHYGAGLKVWSDGVSSAQFNVPKFTEYAGCRTAIQIGDPTQSTLPISEITIPPGFTFNVAQGVRVYSSEAVVNMMGFINIVDSTLWPSTYTGTCSGAVLTVSGINSNGFLNQYDLPTGTGIVAGTYIKGQLTGTLGGNGTYTMSTACTSSGASLTSSTRALNYWASGGNIFVTGGETINAVSTTGYLCLVDIMASPNQYGACSFNGGVIEDAGGLAAAFNPTSISSPIGGRIIFTGGIQGGTSNVAMDAITTDSSFPGTVAVQGASLFAVNSRSGKNIVANNSATKVYFDLQSFGANYLQGFAGVTGGTQFMSSYTGATSAGTPSAPASTTSSTGVMMGLGTTCGLTPHTTGRVQISFVGSSQNTTVNINSMNIRFGTGTAPANGAALTGTAILGNDIKNSITLANNPFSFNVGSIATGLTPGTPYWFDMSLAASGGAANLVQLNCSEIEF